MFVRYILYFISTGQNTDSLCRTVLGMFRRNVTRIPMIGERVSLISQVAPRCIGTVTAIIHHETVCRHEPNVPNTIVLIGTRNVDAFHALVNSADRCSANTTQTEEDRWQHAPRDFTWKWCLDVASRLDP
jgi:hypothetical protein